jgi:hypothetical protein
MMRSELIDSAYRPTLVSGETISDPEQTIRSEATQVPI